MNGLEAARMNGSMNELINEELNGWIDKRRQGMNKSMNEWEEARMNESKDEWTNE